MTSLPWIDWDTAKRVGLELVPAGPRATRTERVQLVAELRADARRAVEVITANSGLTATGNAQERVVSRASIITANVATARLLVTGLTQKPQGALGRAAGQTRGASVGAALALLGSRILGQFDPFSPEPTLYLVAPTIMAVERHLKVNPADFRMWVALHEQTHRIQFANAPWLREHLRSQARNIINAADEPFWHDFGRRLEQIRHDRDDRRPASLRMMNAISTPTAVTAMDEISSVMSLLEGHADVMMDRAGHQVIGSVASIRAKFDARRARGGLTGMVNKLMGMDAKLAQYADGARFCRTVIETGGIELLNLAFTGPQALPSLDELLHPQQWCTRMSLGFADGSA